jgi:hypothetical protein
VANPMEGIEVPRRIASLPKNEAGYPVPWFVSWIDGKPDFRVVDARKIPIAVRENVCWICGEQMQKWKAFVIGPMCAVNLVSSEPPSHTACAKFAAIACPFLSNPKQVRRETNLPTDTMNAAGLGLKRNPGVTLVWVTRSFRPFAAPGGVLFKIGPVEDVFWYAHGREATRAEVLESIDSGLPSLMELAVAESPEAVAELEKMHATALELVPL